MIGDNQIIEVYEGRVDTGTLTGMIFKMDKKSLKEFNPDFNIFYFIIEGQKIRNKKEFESIVKKANL